MKECIFCKIASGEIAAKKVWEDEQHLAILDLNPIKEGHLLLIPRKHNEYIFDLDEVEYIDLFLAAKKIARPLQEAMKTKKIGIIVEGFGVPHVHVHLVPINLGNELDPNLAQHASDAELEKTTKLIKAHLA